MADACVDALAGAATLKRCMALSGYAALLPTNVKTDECAPCRPQRQNTARGRGAWALVSLAGIAIACTVAITFPFFSTVTAVIAALGDLAGAYSLPAIFLLVRSAGPVQCLSLYCRLMRTRRWSASVGGSA